jgi:hypothetical protein
VVLGRGLLLATIGAACGIGGAYWMTPLLESFLFGVKALDSLTLPSLRCCSWRSQRLRATYPLAARCEWIRSARCAKNSAIDVATVTLSESALPLIGMRAR